MRGAVVEHINFKAERAPFGKPVYSFPSADVAEDAVEAQALSLRVVEEGAEGRVQVGYGQARRAEAHDLRHILSDFYALELCGTFGNR